MTKQLSLAVLTVTLGCLCSRVGTADDHSFDFEVGSIGRTSVGVFEPTSGRLVRTLWSGERVTLGRHSIAWDGLDHRGEPVPAGKYEWRVVTAPGFSARYVTTIGINPPGGEHPEPRRSWVGDHIGGGIVDVDPSGVYVGSPMTEGLMMLAKVDAAAKVSWRREQFYQSGRLTKAATSGTHVFMLHPNGKLRRLNKDNGRVEAEWQIAVDGKAPTDVDAHGQNLAVASGHENMIKWISVDSGQELASVAMENPVCLTAMDGSEKGEVIAASGNRVFRVQPGQAPNQVAALSGSIVALDFDPNRKELWAVVDGHQVVRLDKDFHARQTYGDSQREDGPFDPTRFAGINDIAADLEGGFYVGEPTHPPRRIARFARDGSIIDQWFGGMSFYVGATFDPEDPSRLIGIAPEGSINVYHLTDEKWKIEATYSTGRLGDGMFPNAGSFRAIRRNGRLFLYHRVVPAVLRLDPDLGRAVPVAIAGKVLSQGRTFFQFAGTGRNGFPKPWVRAAEHHGYEDLDKTPTLYSWADSNGNGEFDPSEFQFHPNAKRGLSFHNPGDFTSNGDYIGAAKTNETHALVRLPVKAWEGPEKNAPRWDWDQAELAGEIIANSYGYGSPRGVTVGSDDSVSVSYQAGIMIREHGQYEGGRWPEAAMKGSRILAFDSKLNPKFSVGRQSKDAAEINTGVLFYPMQTTTGPNHSIVVNDQTKQPAQVWTHDGLYVGGFFDNREDDGLHDGFYRVHGDDNQGATVVTTKNDETYWLMPYQGHNRLYQITGWNQWHRQSGEIELPQRSDSVEAAGSGLTARYYDGSKLAFQTVEPPIYFEPFGGEPHADKVSAPYKAIWSGYVVPPCTDRFQFRALVGKGEQVRVRVEGRVCYSRGFGNQNVSEPVDLTRGHRHAIEIEYINPDARAELKLLWKSRAIDPQRIPTERLFVR